MGLFFLVIKFYDYYIFALGSYNLNCQMDGTLSNHIIITK